MRRWWMAVGIVVAVMAGRAQAYEQLVKDPEGGAVFGKIVMCNDCKSGAGKGCNDGSEAGWYESKACGKCLIESNYGVTLRYPYDLAFIGKLTDAEGNPVKDRFVKVFLPNGWGIRTRTSELGTFRMSLGATAERKRKEPFIVDLGTHVDSIKDTDEQFAIYMLPETFKPCVEGANAPAKAAPKKDPRPAAKPAK